MLLKDKTAVVHGGGVSASPEIAPEPPSIGLGGEIGVPHRRREFLAELKTTIQTPLTRCGDVEGELFKLAAARYLEVPKQAAS